MKFVEIPGCEAEQKAVNKSAQKLTRNVYDSPAPNKLGLAKQLEFAVLDQQFAKKGLTPLPAIVWLGRRVLKFIPGVKDRLRK